MRILRRRHHGGLWIAFFLVFEAGLVSAHVASPPSSSTIGAAISPHPFVTPATAPKAREIADAVLPTDLRREVVAFTSEEDPGTIIVDAEARALYYVISHDSAIRYGIGSPRDGFEWTGVTTIARKAKWPTWTPPAEMIRREPAYAEFASGMPGGPGNPLGARALYLYSGGQDTLYRIHGTSEPWTIGHPVSSGCFRMLNVHVTELYELVKTGAKVLVK